MSDSKAEIQGALWRIPPVDDTEPPSLDSPGILPGSSGHSRSLQLICTFDNKQENIRRSVSSLLCNKVYCINTTSGLKIIFRRWPDILTGQR